MSLERTARLAASGSCRRRVAFAVHRDEGYDREMPYQSLKDIIHGLTASRFGHPDLLDAEIREATMYAGLLAEQIEDLEAGLDRIREDPDLDDLRAHFEASYQIQIIEALEQRRRAELQRIAAARRRLEGLPVAGGNARR